MFSFVSWMLTIVGASLIVSILNMVTPSGKMGVFCSGIINIFYVYVVISPLLNYILNNL